MKKKWMWFPGDYEVRLARTVNCQRYFRDTIIPPFWRVDDCYSVVGFSREFELLNDGDIHIECTGQMFVCVDGPQELTEFDGTLSLEKGRHSIGIRVFSEKEVPAVCVWGKELNSDGLWECTCNDNIAHPVAVGDKPTGIKFKLKKVDTELVSGGVSCVYDAHEETMGYVEFRARSGSGAVNIYYGESLEEALDKENCELTDRVTVSRTQKTYRTKLTKAFRYFQIDAGGVEIDSVCAISEYTGLTNRGGFKSADPELNKIYEVSLKTLHLSTREFFIDGIKRDRWVWGGDAYQSFLMNYYSFDDSETVKRTLLALLGKPPVSMHVNNIVDYSFFWLIGFCEYFERSADTGFLRQFFYRAAALMDFCISRANGRGLIEGLPGDWVFVDWADGLDNTGEVCYESILYCVALKKMAELCAAAGEPERRERYCGLAEKTHKTVMEVFFDERRQCFIYNSKDAGGRSAVRRQPNIMAVLFDIVPAAQKRHITDTVLMNDSVEKIVTPYMRFFELSALAKMGEAEYVIREIKSYWGGMLRLGATSFWEKYDSRDSGAQHYEMYGRKYGKSLCHAWGAAPLYLLGRYIAGVESATSRPDTFSAKPYLGLEYTADVPIGKGGIKVSVTRKKVTFSAVGCGGAAEVGGRRYEIAPGQTLTVEI